MKDEESFVFTLEVNKTVKSMGMVLETTKQINIFPNIKTFHTDKSLTLNEVKNNIFTK